MNETLRMRMKERYLTTHTFHFIAENLVRRSFYKGTYYEKLLEIRLSYKCLNINLVVIFDNFETSL